MRASHVTPALYTAALAFLGAVVLAWVYRRHVEDAQLAIAGLSVVCVGGAVSALLERRLAAGLCAVIGIIGAWAAAGGIDWWLKDRGRLMINVALVIALFALAVSNQRRDQ